MSKSRHGLLIIFWALKPLPPPTDSISLFCLSPAFLSFLFLYTDRMTRTLPRMSTTMVKISTLASAVGTPEDAFSLQSLSFRDKQFDPFKYFTCKSMSPPRCCDSSVQVDSNNQNCLQTSQKYEWYYMIWSVELLKEKTPSTPPPSTQRWEEVGNMATGEETLKRTEWGMKVNPEARNTTETGSSVPSSRVSRFFQRADSFCLDGAFRMHGGALTCVMEVQGRTARIPTATEIHAGLWWHERSLLD